MTKYLLLSILCVGSMQAIPVIYLDAARNATVLSPQNVHPLVRDLSQEQAVRVLPLLATRVTQNDRGEYVLHAHVRGNGGGPIVASALQWTVRGVCWAGVGATVATAATAAAPAIAAGATAAGVSAATATTIGTGVAAAGAAVGEATMVAGSAGAGAGTVAAASLLAAGTTAGAAGAAAAGATAVLAEGTMAVVVSGATGGSIVGYIELAAGVAYAGGMLIPGI